MRLKNIFLLILLLGLILRFWAALSFESIVWPDEIFQTLEIAHKLVFGYGFVPWEFEVGTRSFAFPLFLALFLLPFRFLPVSGSFCYASFVKLVLCSLSASLIIFSYRIAREFGLRYAGILAAVFTAFWYELIYFSSKALSAIVASYLVLPGLFFASRAVKGRRRLDLILSGILLSLSIVIRFQYGLIWLVPLIFYLIQDVKKRTFRSSVQYLMPSAVVLLAWGVLDWFSWGLPFHSVLIKTYQDMVVKVAAVWGVMPWYWYVEMFWRNQLWLLPVLVVLLLFAWRRAKMLSAALVVVFLAHCLVAHKEYRYVFVVIPILLTLAAVGADVLINRLKQRWQVPAVVLLALVFVLSSGWLAQGYSYERIGYEFTVRSIGQQPLWNSFKENILVYRYLSGLKDIRGLEDRNAPFEWSGGYYHLHHKAPVFYTRYPKPRGICKTDGANYLISREDIKAKGLELVKTVAGVKVYRRY